MVLLFGGINNCADYQNYLIFYQDVGHEGLKNSELSEIGFRFLAYLGNVIGLSYQLFRTLVAIIGLLLIQKTILDFTKKYNLVFLLYFIYPFILDVIQIRNFLAASIVVFSLRFIIKNSRKDDVKYLIAILIAASVHSVSVFFIPFILIKNFTIKQLLNTSIILVPFLCILTSYTFIPNLIRNIAGEDAMFNLEMYFKRANYGFILLWSRQLAICIMSYLGYVSILKSRISQKWLRLDNAIIKLNFYLIIICFPLVMFDGNFTRIFRDISILNYILISHVLYVYPREGHLYLLFAIILGLSFFTMDILISPNVATVLIPFFQSNSYL